MESVKYYQALRKDQDIINLVFTEYAKGKSFVTIGKENNLPIVTVSRIYHENGGIVRTDSEQAKKYSCNSNFFDTIDTEEKAYWLGFMYADGFIQSKRKHGNKRVGITLTESDKGHLEKFKKSVNYTGEIRTYAPSASSYKGTKNYSKIIISDEHLADSLINKGCLENKTNLLIYPTQDIVPTCLERHFIRGLMDGDGSVIITNLNKDKPKVFEISFTGTESMCRGILKFFGEPPTKSLQKRHKERDNDNYSFVLGGKEKTLKNLHLLYDDATIYLDRKYEKYQKMLELSRAKQ